MPDWIVKYWVQWLFSLIIAAITGFGGFIVRKLKKIREAEAQIRAENDTRMEALTGGMTSLLFATLKNSAHQYCSQGWISIHDLDDMEDMYTAYHELGGNGTGTKLFEDLKALPNRPPRKEQQWKS